MLHNLLINSLIFKVKLFFIDNDLTFLSLSLFDITKSNQKRPDKKNSLRLRLRSNSFLSQRNYLFTLRAHGRTLNLTTKEPKSCLINLQGGQHAPDLCLAGQTEGVNILRIFTKPRRRLRGVSMLRIYYLIFQF